MFALERRNELDLSIHLYIFAYFYHFTYLKIKSSPTYLLLSEEININLIVLLFCQMAMMGAFIFHYLNHVEGHLLHPYGLLPFLASCSVATCFANRFRVLASKSGQYLSINDKDVGQEITLKSKFPNIMLINSEG